MDGSRDPTQPSEGSYCAPRCAWFPPAGWVRSLAHLAPEWPKFSFVPQMTLRGASETRLRAVSTPFRTILRRFLAPKALQMAHFGTEKGSEMAKGFFSRMTPEPFGVHKRAFWARFKSVCGHFKLRLAPNPLEMGSKGGRKRAKHCVFPQVAPATPGCSNTCFGSFLEPKKVQNCFW